MDDEPAAQVLLAQDVYLDVIRLHDRLDGPFVALFREHGLSHARYNVLRILRGASRHEASCQRIGEQLVTRVPDVTRLIDRMVKDGLVTRSRSAADRRVVLVRLTDAGRALVDALDEPVNALHRTSFAGVPDTTLRTLHGALRAVLSSSSDP